MKRLTRLARRHARVCVRVRGLILILMRNGGGGMLRIGGKLRALNARRDNRDKHRRSRACELIKLPPSAPVAANKIDRAQLA